MKKLFAKKSRRISLTGSNMLSKIAVSLAFVAIVWIFWSMREEEVQIGDREVIIHNRSQALEVVSELQKELEVTVKERDQYRQQVIMMERSFQIDREVARSLREELKALQAERHKWKEETALVKKLLSDNTINTVLRVRAIEVTPGEIDGQYRFEIAVSRIPDSDKSIKATLSYELIGREADAEQRYQSSDVDPGALDGYALEFRNLGRVEGYFLVPEAFEPQKMRVIVEGVGDKIKGAEKDYSFTGEALQ